MAAVGIAQVKAVDQLAQRRAVAVITGGQRGPKPLHAAWFAAHACRKLPAAPGPPKLCNSEPIRRSGFVALTRVTATSSVRPCGLS